jgi:hypothetical protein
MAVRTSNFQRVVRWNRQDSMVSGNAYARPLTVCSFSEPSTDLVPAGAGKTVLTYAQCLMELSLDHDN